MSTEDDVQQEREFLAEAETMDLSPIREYSFGVAVATGDPNGVKFLCSTIHGPYSMAEMAQEVGDMWLKHQHHAKVIILDKNINGAVRFLDENTVDYIECHYNDIILEETLASAPEDKVYTCAAGTVEEVREEKKDEAKDLQQK